MEINYGSLSSKWPVPVCTTPSVCVELYLGLPPLSMPPSAVECPGPSGWSRLEDTRGSWVLRRCPPQAWLSALQLPYSEHPPPASAYKTFLFSIPASFGSPPVLCFCGFQGLHSLKVARNEVYYSPQMATH